jgi:hypothetical protein
MIGCVASRGAARRRPRQSSLIVAITIDARTKMHSSTCVQTQNGDMDRG